LAIYLPSFLRFVTLLGISCPSSVVYLCVFFGLLFVAIGM
jgi:hypothetical protein